MSITPTIFTVDWAIERLERAMSSEVIDRQKTSNGNGLVDNNLATGLTDLGLGSIHCKRHGHYRLAMA